MSETDPGLRRVAVHAGAAVVDLSLPAAVPVATLIPSIIDILGNHSTNLAATRYQLSRPGATALQSSTTLAQSGIRDGAVLVLSQSPTEPPTHRYDDVAEAVSATLDTATRPPGRRAARLTGALAASGFTAVGAVVLIRNAFSTNAALHTGATPGAVAAAGLIALLFAGIAHRASRDPIAGLALSVIATIFAAVAGLLAVPGSPGVANVLLAAMATAVTAVLAIRVTGCGVVILTAVACCAVVIAVAALAGVVTAAPPYVIGSLTALASLGLLEISARMSILLAGLSPTLPPTLDPDDAEALPAADSLATEAIRADEWLTSLLAAFSSSAAIGAVVAALAAHRAIALAAITGALLLLRARSQIDGRRRLMFVLSGILPTTTTFTVTAIDLPEHGPWIAALTAMFAAVAVYLGFVAPAMSFSPVARRSIEALECLALVVMVPMACWTCSVFSAVRGLDLT